MQRRRKILSLMAHADSLIKRAIVRGEYDSILDGRELSISSEYRDITVQTLALFEWGEEQVAFWTALELAAAFDAPAHALRIARERTNPKYWPSLRVGANELFDGISGAPGIDEDGVPYLKIRYFMLSRWAELKGKGPRYADTIDATSGDKARHYVFPPQTDSNAGIELPYVWLMKDYVGLPEKEILEQNYGEQYNDDPDRQA